MYCRKCGALLNNSATFCHKCGVEVVAVPVEKKVKEKVNVNVRNDYAIPAIVIATIALILCIAPWPREWGIGTALWMKIAIFLLGVVAAFLSRKADVINKDLEKKYQQSVKPGLVKYAFYVSHAAAFIGLVSIVI